MVSLYLSASKDTCSPVDTTSRDSSWRDPFPAAFPSRTLVMTTAFYMDWRTRATWLGTLSGFLFSFFFSFSEVMTRLESTFSFLRMSYQYPGRDWKRNETRRETNLRHLDGSLLHDSSLLSGPGLKGRVHLADKILLTPSSFPCFTVWIPTGRRLA